MSLLIPALAAATTSQFFSDRRDRLQNAAALNYEMNYNSQEAQLARDWSAQQADLTRHFNSIEAQKERDWYQAMSNSAYQRAVADMKAAGINPILAYQQGGAASAATGVSFGSTPVSSAASYQGDSYSRNPSLVSSAKRASKGQYMNGVGSIMKGAASIISSVGGLFSGGSGSSFSVGFGD